MSMAVPPMEFGLDSFLNDEIRERFARLDKDEQEKFIQSITDKGFSEDAVRHVTQAPIDLSRRAL